MKTFGKSNARNNKSNSLLNIITPNFWDINISNYLNKRVIL